MSPDFRIKDVETPNLIKVPAFRIRNPSDSMLEVDLLTYLCPYCREWHYRGAVTPGFHFGSGDGPRATRCYSDQAHGTDERTHVDLIEVCDAPDWILTFFLEEDICANIETQPALP